jgi:hypothetical protein
MATTNEQPDPRELVRRVRGLRERYGVGLITDSYWIPQVLVDNLADALEAALSENIILRAECGTVADWAEMNDYLPPDNIRQLREMSKGNIYMSFLELVAVIDRYISPEERAEIEREKGGGLCLT